MRHTKPNGERSVLITGCSSGIGYAVARGLRERGWRVFATARQQRDVERLSGEGLESLPLDVTDSRSIQATAASVLERTGGRLDALFNNAGYGQPGAVEDLSREVLRAQFETNLFGAHELTCAVLPVMRRQGHGRIIQHSSVLGLVALPYRGAYNASKFALEGLTDTLRQELAGSGIHVCLLETGPVRSRFRANAWQMFQQHIDRERSAHRAIYNAVEWRLASSTDDPFTQGPQAVLRKVVHALESPRPKPRYYITLPTYALGLLRRLLPTRALDTLLLRSTARERR
ncbi:MAG TPA: SDR family NAD(P)-dependent oxidoreductase [Nitrococcus sp.]|nr:SDR family NAD(P)-dependent oxidoreductase [Nitrococcus sp.]